MEYEPHPVDLTNIKIDEALEKDVEEIAKNTHETWAKERKLRGWVYGEFYDESGKNIPA